MAKLVSKTYGEAFFELAIEEQVLDTITEEVEAVQKAFLDNEELIKLLNHPKIDKEEKIKVIETIFKGRVSDSLVGFLVLIVEKDRYNEMEQIFEYFLNKVLEYKNIGVVYVSSATLLTKQQQKQIESRLLEVTKYVQLQMHYTVEESLIGGMIIRIGDRVVDSSIKTKLKKMEQELLKIQLA